MGNRRLTTCLFLFGLACAAKTPVESTGPKSVDVMLIPGCPTTPDGALSVCQRRRVRWGAWLYNAGLTRYFIVSGSNVTTRHRESDALAAGLAALGVPAEVIVVEMHALHTDENVYYAHLLAEQMGFERMGIASDRGQTGPACAMLEHHRSTCEVFDLDTDAIETDGSAVDLDPIRISEEPEATWVPRADRERARAKAAGRRRRPPSWWLYATGALRSQPWVPIPPPHTTVLTWEDRAPFALRDRKSPGSLPTPDPDVPPHPHH